MKERDCPRIAPGRAHPALLVLAITRPMAARLALIGPRSGTPLRHAGFIDAFRRAVNEPTCALMAAAPARSMSHLPAGAGARVPLRVPIVPARCGGRGATAASDRMTPGRAVAGART